MPEPIVPAGNPAAPAQPGTPAPNAGQPAPVVKPGASPTTAAQKPGGPPSPASPAPDKHVPLAALQEEREKRQTLQAELEALRRVAGSNVLFDINGNPVQTVPSPNQAPNVQPDARKHLDELWERNPREAVQAELMMAFQYYDRVNGDLDVQESALASKYPDFTTYRNEVRKYTRTLPFEQRNANVLEAAYFMIKGQRYDSNFSRERADILAKIQAGEAVAGLAPGAASPQAPVVGGQITEEQAKVAYAMGMSPEDYLKNIKV